MGELAFVGLGLWDEKDVSVRGLEIARAADRVFVEWYTAHLGGADTAALTALYGRDVEVLSRSDVEDGRVLLDAARDGNVVLLAAGDALTATTHTELRTRAHKAGIRTRVVHGASIATAAAGLIGLSSYKFGRTTTIVFPEGDYFPTSPYDVVKENKARGLHTLCLLDLRAGGSETENRAATEAAGPRHMTASEGAALLVRMEKERGEGVLAEDAVAFAVARAGSPEPVVARGTLAALAAHAFGPPLHVLIVPGDVHWTEADAVEALTLAL